MDKKTKKEYRLLMKGYKNIIQQLQLYYKAVVLCNYPKAQINEALESVTETIKYCYDQIDDIVRRIHAKA